ncbi:unnamed protein product [Arctia plantaginis]|uniref:E3 ubiquitin-protein ligase n=1 Tax=Arctia plantaginis TaxID=874455 RepID=A0A8S1AF76_ARCPL|nr:unnamed protein product [Arctia plantaginis]
MGNRKQNLKKSLGLSEYPWSSDDDDDGPRQSNEEILPATNREPRPSVADQPGTSGLAQPQSEQATPRTSRRIQANLDRDMFWSIINNTPRPTINNYNTRSRINDPSLASTSRSGPSQAQPPPRPNIEVRLPDQRAITNRRRHIIEDVHRILAFKKLTRTLHNLAQNRANISSANFSNRPSLSHSSPRVSRPPDRPPHRPPGPGFAPAGGSRGPPFRRSVQNYPTNNQVDPQHTWHYRSGAVQANGTPVGDQIPSTSQAAPDPFIHVVDHSEDELQAVEPTAVQPMEPDHETNDPEEEEIARSNIMDAALNDNGSGARLIEEVVEVDAPDEPDNNPAPTETEANEGIVAPVAENRAGAANAAENAETAQEGPSYGVKRKRDSTDDTREPFSVQDFNQSLLRLLECPVCLEWMEPPISQCRRGHLVCSRCRARLTACPVCRTPFSSVRNRAMEGVAEMLRYPCRHGCGREVRLRKRAPHEASCPARRYVCPAPACARLPALPHTELAHHFQTSHPLLVKMGCKHKFSTKVNSEQHDTWIIRALDEFFHLRVDIDIRTWGVIVYVAYIGPKRNANSYTYEVTVEGQHNSRKLVYTRATHSDLESSSVNVSRQDCFHLTLDQALNFLRINNRHCEPDKFLDFEIQITKWESVEDTRDESDS